MKRIRLFEKGRKKIGNGRGFTLAETLLAVLIMLMVSLIMATGIPAAKQSYENVVVASNADVLLSTTVQMLRNELGTAKNITVNTEDNSITYFNTGRGSFSQITVPADKKGIYLQRYYESESLTGLKPSDPEPLISSTAATGDLYATYENVVLKTDSTKVVGVTFSGLEVKHESGETTPAKGNITIRVVS